MNHTIWNDVWLQVSMLCFVHSVGGRNGHWCILISSVVCE